MRHLPSGRSLVLGRRMVGYSQRSGLYGFRRQRCRPHGWGRRRVGGRHRCRPARGAFRPARGIRAAQLAAGRPGHLHPLVRLVWLQLRLDAGHERHRVRLHGRAGRHEHHPRRSRGRPHGVLPAAHPDDGRPVRHRGLLQRHLGGPRLDHRALRQRRLRLGGAHRLRGGPHLPGHVDAHPAGSCGRPHRRLRRARRLRRLGCPRRCAL
mmetsp:Transcript_134276/g.347807  ORF Transcript_134276/g.347807 Transcript_134276/m.347807 type:complete len:208 (-) Transcript_134276:548-1171(-)